MDVLRTRKRVFGKVHAASMAERILVELVGHALTLLCVAQRDVDRDRAAKLWKREQPLAFLAAVFQHSHERTRAGLLEQLDEASKHLDRGGQNALILREAAVTENAIPLIQTIQNPEER